VSESVAANLGLIALRLADLSRFVDDDLQWSSAEQYDALTALNRVLTNLVSVSAESIQVTVGKAIDHMFSAINREANQLAVDYEARLAKASKEASQATAKLHGMQSQIAAIQEHRDELQEKINYLTARTALDAGVRDRVFAMTNGRCFYCDSGLVMTGSDSDAGAATVMHIDHIVPKSAGGPDHLTNYVPACGPCNLAKNGRPYLEFIRDRHPRLKLVVSTEGA